jgi:hypothetical protein
MTAANGEYQASFCHGLHAGPEDSMMNSEGEKPSPGHSGHQH